MTIEFDMIVNKERGFNKLDTLASVVEKQGGVFNFKNHVILNQVVMVDVDNTVVYPSEREYLDVQNESFFVGRNILGVHRLDGNYLYESTSLFKYLVTSDRFYRAEDNFISSDWATLFKVSYQGADAYIPTKYFNDKDATILDYLKYQYGDSVVVKSLFIDMSGAVVIVI